MCGNSVVRAIAATLLANTLVTHAATAGDIDGSVIDWSTRKGINGVQVMLVEQGPTLKDLTSTNPKGEYFHSGLANGTHTLRYTTAGYYDLDTPVPILDGVTHQNVKLIKKNPGSAYFSIVADQIVEEATASRAKKTSYRDNWVALRAMNLPPTFKLILVQEIDQKDKQAKEILPALKDYLAANADDIMQADAQFEKSWKGDMPVPRPSEIRVGNEIVTDIVLSKFHAPSVGAEQRRQFYEKFRTPWGATAANTELKAWVADRPKTKDQ